MVLDRDILTPEQAAEYLQVNRETIYRYIRGGQLIASRLGRTYRIPKQSLDLLLWTTRTRPDLVLRDYSESEIADFMQSDELDPQARQIAERFTNPDIASTPAGSATRAAGRS